jgi:hypothetical protein
MLHDLANRRGHTALLIGGASASREDMALVMQYLQPDGAIVEATVALAANPHDAGADGSLDPATAERLGADSVTLLLIRADGHIALRAESDHAAKLSGYINLLRSGPAEAA